jgi:hypothetical protein
MPLCDVLCKTNNLLIYTLIKDMFGVSDTATVNAVWWSV